jgi:hypothetical protein
MVLKRIFESRLAIAECLSEYCGNRVSLQPPRPCVVSFAPLAGPDSCVPGVVLREERIEGFPDAVQVEAEIDQQLGGSVRPRLAGWVKFLKEPGAVRGGVSAR